MQNQNINFQSIKKIILGAFFFIIISILPIVNKRCENTCDSFGCYGCLMFSGIFSAILWYLIILFLLKIINVKDIKLKKQQALWLLFLIVAMLVSWNIFTYDPINSKWESYRGGTNRSSLSVSGAKKLIDISNDSLTYKQELRFDGLTKLNSSVAKEIAKFKGNKLVFMNLEKIKPEVAKELSVFKGHLYFQNLSEFNFDTAKELVKFEGQELSLGGNIKIDYNIAKELARFRGDMLSLAGVKQMDPLAVKEFAEFNGTSLRLGGMGAISVDVAKSISQFKCKELFLGAVYPFDKNVAKEIINFRGDVLSLDGYSELNEETVKELVKFKGASLGIGGDYEFSKVVEDIKHTYEKDLLKQILEKKCGENVKIGFYGKDNIWHKQKKILIDGEMNVNIKAIASAQGCDLTNRREWYGAQPIINKLSDKHSLNNEEEELHIYYSKEDGVFCYKKWFKGNGPEWFDEGVSCGIFRWFSYEDVAKKITCRIT